MKALPSPQKADERSAAFMSLCVLMRADLRRRLLKELSKYLLCDFFLRLCVQNMSDKEVAQDLDEEPEFALLCHFANPKAMGGLEKLFADAIKVFGLSKEQLKAQADFNFDVFDMTGFEGQRGVFRLANALAQDAGFSEFAFLKGDGLCDLTAMKDGEQWYIEIKTLILQTKEREFRVKGGTEILNVDKFQPESNNIADYVEAVTKKIAGSFIERARQQLIETAKKKGEGKKMVALVVNLFAAEFFLDRENCAQVYANLSGKSHGWEKNYLAALNSSAFLTDKLYLFP